MTKKIISNKEVVEKINKLEKFITTRKENQRSILRFPGKIIDEEKGDLSPNLVLAEAFDQLDQVIIAGIDKEGRFWMSMNMSDDAKALWLIENFKMAVLESALEMEWNEGFEI